MEQLSFLGEYGILSRVVKRSNRLTTLVNHDGVSIMTTSDNGSTPRADRQLSLFEPVMDSRIRRVEINGAVCFSILDTFEYAGSQGSAKNPRKYWADARKRLEKQGTEVVTAVLQHKFAGQGQRETPVAPFKFFLRLAQVVEIKEWEHIRQWMAEVAHERIEEEANPELGIERAAKRAIATWKRQGHDDQWIDTRFKTVADRKTFADMLATRITDLIPKVHYAAATNLVSEGLWGRDVPTLRAEMGIKGKQTPRDFQPRQGLLYNSLVEATIADIFAKYDHLDWIEAVPIIKEVASVFGFQADQLGKMLGIDLATGKPLLKGKQ